MVTFTYENTTVIRMMSDEQDEPLFCLADVCKVLEITDTSNVSRQLKEEFSTPVLNTGMVMRPDSSSIEATFITEPQLYFVMMRSRSDKARPFRQWVVNEVLPSIRKTGKYEIKKENPVELLKKVFEDTVSQIMVLNKTYKIEQEPTQSSLSVPGATLTLCFGDSSGRSYNRVTPSIQNKIIELYRAGFSQKDIANKTSVSPASVSKFLKRISNKEN